MRQNRQFMKLAVNMQSNQFAHAISFCATRWVHIIDTCSSVPKIRLLLSYHMINSKTKMVESCNLYATLTFVSCEFRSCLRSLYAFAALSGNGPDPLFYAHLSVI